MRLTCFQQAQPTGGGGGAPVFECGSARLGCAWCGDAAARLTRRLSTVTSQPVASRRVASPPSVRSACSRRHPFKRTEPNSLIALKHNSHSFEQRRRSRSGSRIGRPAAGSRPQPRSLPLPLLRRHAASAVECRLVTLAGVESSPAAPAALFRRAVPAADLLNARDLRRPRVAAPRALPAGDRRHAHPLQGQNRSV